MCSIDEMEMVGVAVLRLIFIACGEPTVVVMCTEVRFVSQWWLHEWAAVCDPSC